MKKIVLYIGLILALPSEAQEDSFYQLQYREKVLHYNQDIKAADYQVSMRTEMTQSARANFLPKLSADADFKYTGNPLQLTRTVGDIPISFEGRNIHYGGSLTLAQPIYMGGSLQAAYRKALQEKSLAEQERRHILNNIAYDADVHYWNAVAGREMVGVAAEYKKAVSRLVTVVKHRVEVEYIDKNDLLMAEVKLNEADYQWLQAINQAEVTNLALYSFAGLETNEDLSTDSIVVALKQGVTEIPDVMAALEQRPEMQIARSHVGIQESTGKIANAQYLPKISVVMFIEQAHPKSFIVFTTAYDTYAVKAFEVNSIDYLLKPIHQERLLESILRFEKLNQQHVMKNETSDFLDVLLSLSSPEKKYRTRFLISGTNRLFTLQVTDIAYFLSENKTTLAVTKNNQMHIIDISLDKLNNQLNPDHFFRANRQFILGIDAIKRVEPYFNSKMLVSVVPAYNGQIIVSKEKATQLKMWLNY